MATTTGRLTAVGIGKESTYGTAVSRTNWIKVYADLTGFTEKVAVTPIPVLRHGGASNPAYVNSYDGLVTVEGKMSGPFMYDGIGILIENAMGATVSSTSDGAPETHTYNLGTAVNGLTLEIIRGDTGNSEIIVGAVIRSLSIIFEPGKPARWEADFVAQKADASRSSAGTPSFTAFSGANLVTNNVKGHQAASISWNSASYTIHTRITYTWARNLIALPELGSRYIGEVVLDGYSAPTVTVDRMDSGDALYNGHRAGTQSDLTQAITGTGNLAIAITARNCKISDENSDLSTAGPIAEKVVFMAHSDDSDNALTIAITNESGSGTAN